MNDHERIWLEPKDSIENPEMGRLWCQDPVWTDEENAPATEYIRVDLHESLQADLIQETASKKTLVTEYKNLKAKLKQAREERPQYMICNDHPWLTATDVIGASLSCPACAHAKAEAALKRVRDWIIHEECYEWCGKSPNKHNDGKCHICRIKSVFDAAIGNE